MALGKSIRIYLKDGTVTGIKFGEVLMTTIQSISCPRSRVSELSAYPEAKRPGVYFLFGADEETNEPKAYIGEAENVFDRLQDHIAKKEFWNEVIMFISKDENLTKGHVRYLESRSIQMALASKRYIIDNYNQSQLAALPPADRDAMEEFLIYQKLLLGVLGHKLLEELITTTPKPKQQEPIVVPQPRGNGTPVTVTDTDQIEELFLSIGGMNATGYNTDEGIVVRKGSQATTNIAQSLQNGYRALRDKLIQNGTLKLEGDKYVFQSDYLFDTASPAAAIVVGYSINGREHWKDKNGRSLKIIETESLK
jgi:hypothetical protein